MARTTAAPPAPPAPPSREPERLTLKLSRPIKADDGRTWSEITIVEPELSHHIEADRKASGMERAIAIYATISGIPEDAIRRLKTIDAKAIQRWINGLRGGEPPVDNGGVWTFSLAFPIEVDGQPVAQISLREPDLEAGIALEKFNGKPNAQIAASIAALSGLTIPIVRRMKMRDVAQFEAWLYPFVADTTSETSPGAMSPSTLPE